MTIYLKLLRGLLSNIIKYFSSHSQMENKRFGELNLTQTVLGQASRPRNETVINLIRFVSHSLLSKNNKIWLKRFDTTIQKSSIRTAIARHDNRLPHPASKWCDSAPLSQRLTKFIRPRQNCTSKEIKWMTQDWRLSRLNSYERLSRETTTAAVNYNACLSNLINLSMQLIKSRQIGPHKLIE